MRLVFGTWKSCKLPNDIVKDEATKMSSGCVYTRSFADSHTIYLCAVMFQAEGLLYSYRRGLSALLVQQYRAMQEPPSVGRATERFPRFLFMP